MRRPSCKAGAAGRSAAWPASRSAAILARTAPFSPAAFIVLSSRIGIRTVASNDTHNYDARGEFGLDDTLLVLLKREQDRAIAAASPQPSAA